MSTFTIHHGNLPPNNIQLLFSLPLEPTTPLLASSLIQTFNANAIYLVDPQGSGNIFPRTAADLIENAGNMNIDFTIDGGIGYILVSSSWPGTDIVFSGNGWCNVYDPNNPSHPTPCP